MASKTTKSSIRTLSSACKHLVVPSGIVKTGWPSVEGKLAELGIRFDWWQESASKLILGKDGDGVYATSEASVCMSIPRQTGKTTMVGGLVVALALLHPGLTVLWTAHVLRTSNMTFGKMRSMCSRELIKPLVEHMRLANGEGEILFKNGSRIMFGARERGFGLGFDNVSILVFDEAQRLSQPALDDMIPTTAVAVNPLVFLIGTPPRPSDKGDAFRNRREEALSGNGEGLLWIEFGADDGTDPFTWSEGFMDWEQIAKANPSYPHRVGKTAIRRMKKNLGPESFSREGLGLWDQGKVDRLIPVDQWSNQLVTSESEILPESERIIGDVVACIEVSRDRKNAWIALCGERSDGTPQVEIPVCLPKIRVAGWLEERRDRVRAVTGQSRGAGATTELVKELSLDPSFKIPVEEWQGDELTAAHGRALDALRDSTVRTVVNDDLEEAVQVAVGKDINGGVVVDRKLSAGEVGPLEAWVGAYGLWTRPKKVETKIAPASPEPVPVVQDVNHRSSSMGSFNVSRMGF